VGFGPSGDNYNYNSFGSVWRLAVGFVSPGDSCRIRGSKGVWRLAVCGARQAVWNRISLGDFGATSGDNKEVECLFAFYVRGLQGFGYTLKTGLVECSLSCGSERIP